MKTVRIGEKNYSVLLSIPRPAYRPTKDPKMVERVILTQVSIYSDDLHFEAIGFAICSPQDTPNGKLGVQLALRRALKKIKVERKTLVASDWAEAPSCSKIGMSKRLAPAPAATTRSLSAEEKALFYQLFGWGKSK